MDIRKRCVVISLPVAVLLTAPLITTAAASSIAHASSSPRSLPTWAHGSITGAGPHNGVRLELVAWPRGKIRVGQKVHLQVVGKATSSSSGSYAIHSSVALPKGIHNLEVLAHSPKAVGAFSFPRKIAAGGRALGVDGSASTRPVTANIHMMALPKSALSAVPEDFNICFATTKKIREIGQELVDVGGLYSLMPDGKMQLTYSAGSSTTIGVGVSAALPEGVGSFTAGGTFTETTSGAEKFPALVGKIVNEQTPYTFGEYTNVCGLLHQVQPEIWATGLHKVNVKPPPIDKCGENLGGGGTFTRKSGTAGTFKAGVDLKKVIGISLSAQSGYNKQVSITYTAPSEGGFMCGSNNLPILAAWDLMSPCNSRGVCVGSSSTASTRASARSRGASHPAGGTSRSR